MGTTTTDCSLCVLVFAASKCNSVSPAALLVSIFLLSVLLYWAHPGGPAWARARSSSIPGPRGLPILGSIPLMMGLPHHKIAAVASSLSAARLMAFSLGPYTRVVVSCHPDSARGILNSPAFSDRPLKESAYSLLFHRAIGFAPYGSYWRLLRRIASNHMFSPNQIISSHPLRASVATQLNSLISACATESSFPIGDLVKRASLANMMWAVFGREYGLDDKNDVVDDLREMVDEGYDLLGRFNWSDHLPCFSIFDFQGIRSRCSRLVARVNRFVGKIIEDHKSNPAVDGVNRDFVDVLLSLNGPDRLSEPDMIAVLWEMIFRGTDTVAVLIEWILARMVLHPHVQTAVHNELDKVVGRTRAVSDLDIPSLAYLTAVIKETLRLHPPGPLLSWARIAITDTTVDGHVIPAGTTAMVNMYAIARNQEFWPDPLEFKPERFLPGSGSASLEYEFSVMGSDLRLAPFGSGRRSCPGKALGMATVTYWVAALLDAFQWKTSEGATVDLSEVLKLSCEMAHPLHVRVRPRRESELSIIPYISRSDGGKKSNTKNIINI